MVSRQPLASDLLVEGWESSSSFLLYSLESLLMLLFVGGVMLKMDTIPSSYASEKRRAPRLVFLEPVAFVLMLRSPELRVLVLLVLRVLLEFQLSFPMDVNELCPFLPNDIMDECLVMVGLGAVPASIASIFPMA